MPTIFPLLSVEHSVPQRFIRLEMHPSQGNKNTFGIISMSNTSTLVLEWTVREPNISEWLQKIKDTPLPQWRNKKVLRHWCQCTYNALQETQCRYIATSIICPNPTLTLQPFALGHLFFLSQITIWSVLSCQVYLQDLYPFSCPFFPFGPAVEYWHISTNTNRLPLKIMFGKVGDLIILAH